MIRDNFLYRLVCVAACLALVVVTLGAFTRLKDAGLGCPDWPGCYGHLTVPISTPSLVEVQQHFSGAIVEPVKAWAEMIHRYVAGTLGLLIFVILARSWWTRHRYQTPLALPVLLTILVIFQACLGRWTVTLKLLPPIVMLHLLGGLTLLALLSLFVLRLGCFFNAVKEADKQRFKWWALLGLLIVIGQIILGGWTSANYASLSCPNFPYCHNTLVPTLNFTHAFTLGDKMGQNYQGGVLDQMTRMTIQFTHRVGAACVFFYWLIFLLYMLAKAESRTILRFTILLFFMLVLQMLLGVMNVILLLPLHIAVSHNGSAALLLVVVVALNYALFVKARDMP